MRSCNDQVIYTKSNHRNDLSHALYNSTKFEKQNLISFASQCVNHTNKYFYFPKKRNIINRNQQQFILIVVVCTKAVKSATLQQPYFVIALNVRVFDVSAIPDHFDSIRFDQLQQCNKYGVAHIKLICNPMVCIQLHLFRDFSVQSNRTNP